MTDAAQRPGCLSIIFNLFGVGSSTKGASSETFPFQLRENFLSPAELSLYHVLRQVAYQRAAVVPKVRLADLFSVRDFKSNRGAFNQIAQKHVDFVLCDPRTMKPLCAVELDDRSHQQSKQQKRDAFVDGVFMAAGLPLVHVAAQKSYNVEELRAQLAPFLPEQAKKR